MEFVLNRVIKLEDFREPVMRHALREIFAQEASRHPEFPAGREHRKQWEIAMAALALKDGGALRPDAQVLGIGAGSEGTLFWLTNRVGRVWATDLYANPGAWNSTAPPTMLTDPGSAWEGRWNPRRLVVQHMDACNLQYEDETFDAIFSSGSIEHFGSLERIGTAMDEAFRTLKPGGIASFSTEFLIEGEPLLHADETVMFTPELIERVLLGTRDWAFVSPVDYAITDATMATEIDIDEYLARPEPTYPHCVLRIGPNVLTSVHLMLVKAPKEAEPRSPVPPRGSRRLAWGRVARKRLPSRSPVPLARAVGKVGSLPRVPAQYNESSLKRIARRVARPVLSPIDGRVADINRRIEHSRQLVNRQSVALQELAGQSETIDSFVRGSMETSSYIGVELRRIQETLASVQERTLDEYYQMRLAHGRDCPLEDLDHALADAINHANGIHGFYAQAGLFFNHPISVALSQGAARTVHVNERIVEVPFAMAALTRLQTGARVLDVGSAESTFALSAASLGYEVTAIDPRPLAYSHPNLINVQSLLENWQPPHEPFAAVFMISTVEHVGLGAYSEGAYGDSEPGVGADRALMDRVRGLIAPDGVLVLTVPYGTREVTELQRIYDEPSLTALLDGWTAAERQLVVRRDALTWEPDDHVEAGGRGVAMVIARPR